MSKQRTSVLTGAIAAGIVGLAGFLQNLAVDSIPGEFRAPWIIWPLLVVFAGISVWLSQSLGQERGRGHDFFLHWRRSQRARLLEAVHRYWLTAVLRPSLAPLGWLPVRLRECDVTGQSRHLLPPNSDLADIFMDGGQMVIVGNQGVGKTILLAKLAERLIEQCREDRQRPVPVIVPLSSWAQRPGPFDVWLVTQLHTIYGIEESLGWFLVREGFIVPLLDGLDEVHATQRDACLRAIQVYQQKVGITQPLVMTCRVDAYRALSAHIRVRRIIKIEPPTEDEIRQHLERTDTQQLTALMDHLRNNPLLMELVGTPFFFSAVTYAYQGVPLDAIPEDVDLSSLRKKVLADYVARRLKDEADPRRQLEAVRSFSEPRVVWRTLRWLARKMKLRNETLFVPDEMQPELLAQRQHRWFAGTGLAAVVGVTAYILFGTLGGITVWAISDQAESIPNALAADLLAGTAAGIIAAWLGLKRKITPIRPPEQSGRELLRVGANAVLWGMAGAALGWPMGQWFGTLQAQQNLGWASLVVVGLCGSLLGGAVGGLVLGLVIGLSFGAVRGLRPQRTVRLVYPGSGMNDTLTVAIGGGLLALVGGVLTYGLVFGLPFSFMIALRLGGTDYLRHRVLRWLLYRERAVPYAFLDFLHYTYRHGLLNEVGGGYMFTNPYLQEYFAVKDGAAEAPTA